MNAEQVPIPEHPDEIMCQTEAYRYMGVTRPVFRGFVDRGEIHPADHRGARKSGRFWRRDVERLMAERGIVTPRSPLPEEEGKCPGCRRLRAALEHSQAETAKERKARARARRLLDAALEDDDLP